MAHTSNNDALSADAITRSGRWAFFGLFGGAGFWLVLAGLCSLIASVKMHSPDILADSAWLSYGRLKGAANSMLLFGFATQAAIGVSLWLAAILGRTEVRLSVLTLGISKFYNLVMLIGVIGVLLGDVSGFAWFEFPRYAAGLLLVAFVALALPVFITFHNRTERQLHPSLWFVIGGLFWFAWVYTTGYLLLHAYPVRGILVAGVHGWLVSGLITVWLVPIAIAVILHLLPSFSGGVIPSRATLLLAFWGLAVIGPFGGIEAGTPLPSWVGALSTAMFALLLIPVLAVYYSVAGMKIRVTDPMERVAGRFVDFSFLCLLALGVFTLVNSFEAVSSITRLTYVDDALKVLAILGVGASAFFAVAFLVVSKLAPTTDKCSTIAGMQFQIFRAGVAVMFLSLAFAGLQQGRALADPGNSFMDVVAASKMMFRLSTLGELVVLASAVVFAFYVVLTTMRSLKEDWKACDWCGGKVKEVAA